MNAPDVPVDPPWPAVDPLGEALRFLRMTGAMYCHSELTAPWGLEMPPMRRTLMFHVVTSGRCMIAVDGAPAQPLQAGELALVPHGGGHRLGSAPGAPSSRLFDLPREAVGERFEVLRHGGGGDATTLVCGALRYDHPAASHLVALLPRLIHVRPSAGGQDAWLRDTLRFMAEEARDIRAGADAVLARLADVLVIQAIRSWIHDGQGAPGGWLGALRDPQVGRAIALVHRDPAHPWTVDALASASAMSRSAFSARFAELVGEPPMRYVARCRMNVALESLQGGSARLGELAARLGYTSEAAFSRAFKRLVGIPPGAVRRGQAPVAGWPD